MPPKPRLRLNKYTAGLVALTIVAMTLVLLFGHGAVQEGALAALGILATAAASQMPKLWSGGDD